MMWLCLTSNSLIELPGAIVVRQILPSASDTSICVPIYYRQPILSPTAGSSNSILQILSMRLCACPSSHKQLLVNDLHTVWVYSIVTQMARPTLLTRLASVCRHMGPTPISCTRFSCLSLAAQSQPKATVAMVSETRECVECTCTTTAGQTGRVQRIYSLYTTSCAMSSTQCLPRSCHCADNFTPT